MSAAQRPWEQLLRTPFPCDHIIQLYTDEEVLLRALERFAGSGLEQGEAVVVVATAEHLAALTKRLIAGGQKLPSDIAEGAFITFDAERCVARFMRNGVPDRAAFRAVVGPILDRLKAAGYERIRLFGEMVNLLWQHNGPGTVQLEELWNEVIAEHQVCLLCAYHVEAADAESRRGLLHQISRCHSHSFPEDYGSMSPDRLSA